MTQDTKRHKQQPCTVDTAQEAAKRADSFEVAARSLAVGFMKTIRGGISEQSTIIDGIIKTIQTAFNKPQGSCLSPTTANTTGLSKQILIDLQTAIEELRNVSDDLNQRLFHLDQQLIRGHQDSLEAETKRLRGIYQQEIQETERRHQQEKQRLLIKLEVYQARCEQLEHYLMPPAKEPDQEQKQRKWHLQGYLVALEELAREVELLKSENKGSHPTDASRQTLSLQPIAFCSRSVQEQSGHPTTAQERHRLLWSAQNSKQQISQPSFSSLLDDYYPEQHHKQAYPGTGFEQCGSVRSTYVDLGRVRSHEVVTVAPPVCSPSQRVVLINHPPRDRGLFKGAEQRLRCSEEKTRKLSSNRHSNDMLAGTIRASPAKIERYLTTEAVYGKEDTAQKRVEQRNARMKSVQENLYGLKRKLLKEMRTMKL